jgi:DNA-binding CsgD family transcriptional regulator
MTSKRIGVISPLQEGLSAGIGAALECLDWIPTMLQYPGGLSAIGSVPAVLLLNKEWCQPYKVMSACRPSRCVVVTTIEVLAMVIPLADAGSFVLNAATPFVLLVRLIDQAIRQILSGQKAGRASAARLRCLVREVDALGRLTPQEALTLQALMSGDSAMQIADRTHRSLHTVRSQIRSLCTKLGVNSQVSALGIAERSGSFTAVDIARGTFGAFTDGIVAADG